MGMLASGLTGVKYEESGKVAVAQTRTGRLRLSSHPTVISGLLRDLTRARTASNLVHVHVPSSRQLRSVRSSSSQIWSAGRGANSRPGGYGVVGVTRIWGGGGGMNSSKSYKRKLSVIETAERGGDPSTIFLRVKQLQR